MKVPRKRYRLLIVDDEPANLQKLRRTFADSFEIHEADNGMQALKLLEGEQFSAIITDQRMPGISGVELLRQSLQTSPNAIRIILTGYTEVEDLMSAINEGQVSRYITKPWEPYSLRQTVLQDIEHRELKRENQLLNEQLRIAEEVQSRLFPKVFPQVAGLEYSGLCRPARKVGGDYYDFFRIAESRLWISVADISGKGISAALLMANLQALLRSHAIIHGSDLAALLAAVNRQLHATTDESKYATLFCAILDAAEGRLSYVNAGHCPAILASPQPDGLQLMQLEATGTPVGLFEQAVFEQRTLQLDAGDLLLVYTDGITEALNSRREMFGWERLTLLLSSRAPQPVSTLCKEILREVDAHSGGEQQDDMTVVACRLSAQS